MKITFAFREKRVELPCAEGDSVTLYSVCTDYSPDGLYIARWCYGETEPYPACLGSDTTVLARVTIQLDMDNKPIINGFLHKEVSAHATL